MERIIKIQGARTHNLKSVDCAIPHRVLTVITGVSGSGKSSLALDTLYAEGQMRYVESLSAYSRQFMERMQRPDVDRITGILPAIALEQKNTVKSARSTVGTATEINDYLRLLYANIGRTICPECGEEVAQFTPEAAAEEVMHLPTGASLLVLAPLAVKAERLESLKAELQRSGFRRIRVAGRIEEVADLSEEKLAGHDHVELVVDRIVLGADAQGRVTEALEAAFKAGGGQAAVVLLEGEGTEAQRLPFDVRFRCRHCGTDFAQPEQELFSFNNPIGACPTCEGFGRVSRLAEEKVVPNPSRDIRHGAVAPFNTPAYHEMQDDLERMANRRDIPLDKPYKELSAGQRKLIWDGEGDYVGIRGFFNWLETKRYKVHVRVMIARYRGYTTCPTCGGKRLRPEALNVRVAGKTIADLWAMSVKDLREFFVAFTPSAEDKKKADVLLKELSSRLAYLEDVGLGYLTLDRQTRTLSGGEAQRINLSAALGSSLTNTLYVLDEPTVGLHARDTHRLLDILTKLIEKGNTVVVVEHDPEVITAAEHIIDIGPGAGEHGGEVIFQGDPEKLSAVAESETAKQMQTHTHRAISPYARRRRGFIRIRGAAEHNLKDLDVRIPLGVLCCVTGVSGSGKSTLVNNILYAAYRRHNGNGKLEVGRHRKIEGYDKIDDIILVDQSSIGRSTRSNAVTYIKAYDEVRRMMASTIKARVNGITAGDFSFNVTGGRCETCKGVGTITHEMYFMADVTVTCGDCEGKKFKKKVLDIRYGGRNISDILEMTVTEAMAFFRKHPRLVRRLRPLADVGLGYLRLGQNTATLSGGEAQRLKLAGHIAQSKADKQYLFIFDEPTTGLHLADVAVLLRVLHRLVNQGHSLLVIEHNLDFITQADWIIDLGPEGGDEGGYIVGEGTVAQVAKCKKSYTAVLLRSRIAEADSIGAVQEDRQEQEGEES